jgi:flavorubredoxin
MTEHVSWLGCCNMTTRYGNGKEMHIHRGNYLVVGTNGTLLVDTGTPPGFHVVCNQLDSLLGDRPLDWVFPTHIEPAHAASLPQLLDHYPNARGIGDMRDAHLFFPAHAHRLDRVGVGDVLDLGGVTMHFLAPAFWDMPTTLWAYIPEDQVLFPADAFGYAHQMTADGDEVETYHLAGQCALYSSELPGAVAPEQMSFLVQAAFYWSRHVDVEQNFERLAALFREHPTRFVAPSHGNVVSNPDEIVDVMRRAYTMARQTGK